MAKGRFRKPAVKKDVADTKNGAEDDAPSTTVTSSLPTFRELPFGEAEAARRSVGDISIDLSPSPLLITLLFDDKAIQHAAMARIEAFYESAPHAERQFLSLEHAKQKRICQNYEAFNCPISSVGEWLDSLKSYHHVNDEGDQDTDNMPVWLRFTNEHEATLIGHLIDRGCITDGKQGDLNGDRSPSIIPQYLVTALRSQARTSLPHEHLHFLYYISSAYRQEVGHAYEGLTTKTRKIIETDLSMRKYAQHVWPDEFQAYVSENAGEFGAKTVLECTPIRARLRQLQHRLWKELTVKA